MAIRNPSPARTFARSARPRRAFSLVELLVVILIIGIIVAIVLPALSGVRDSAKEADTKQLTTQVATAASSFFNDNRRSPGYFTPQEMGDATNQNRGMSAMQNAMLDLAGGVVRDGTAGAIRIGPSNVLARQVLFLPEAVGAAGTKAYFAPNAKNFKRQDGIEGGTRTGDQIHAAVPELVDSWGQPILAWAEDPTAKQAVQAVGDFASFAAPGNNANASSARFYLVSNYALLESNAFGKQRRDQNALSILSPTAASNVTSLAGALGNPGAPDDPTKNLSAILPTRSRGAFIAHSAGRDGVILSRQGKGTRVIENADTNPVLYFGSNFKSLPGPAGTVIRDNTGKAVSQDVLAAFDDIIASSN